MSHINISSPTSHLGGAETFPYDCLDIIFAYACTQLNRTPPTCPKRRLLLSKRPIPRTPSDVSLSRALDLGLVCRFWYDRFCYGDPMWNVIIEHRGLLYENEWTDPKFSSGKAQISREDILLSKHVPFGLTWPKEASFVRKAFLSVEQLKPIPSQFLHPVERPVSEVREENPSDACSCPLYVEEWKTESEEEVSFSCSACGKRAHLVEFCKDKPTFASPDDDCYVVSANVRNNLLFHTNVKQRTVLQFLVLAESESTIRTAMKRLASEADDVTPRGGNSSSSKRSVGIFPFLNVRQTSRSPFLQFVGLNLSDPCWSQKVLGAVGEGSNANLYKACWWISEDAWSPSPEDHSLLSKLPSQCVPSVRALLQSGKLLQRDCAPTKEASQQFFRSVVHEYDVKHSSAFSDYDYGLSPTLGRVVDDEQLLAELEYLASCPYRDEQNPQEDDLDEDDESLLAELEKMLSEEIAESTSRW